MDYKLKRKEILNAIRDVFEQKAFNKAIDKYTSEGEYYWINFKQGENKFTNSELNYVEVNYEDDNGEDKKYYYDYKGSIKDPFDIFKLQNLGPVSNND